MKPAIRSLLLALLFLSIVFVSSPFDSPTAHVLLDVCGAPCGHRTPGEVPPPLLIALCLVRLAFALAATFVVGTLARRTPRNLGLVPLGVRRMGWGVAWGATAIALVVSALNLLGYLTIRGLHTEGTAALAYGLVWAAGMWLVGAAEEVAFRAAPVMLLVDNSPLAAVALSAAAFVLAHTGNTGENASGLLQIGLFGAVCAISVVKTHSISFAVGFHAAWNWTLEYFFGATGSGYSFEGHLLSTTIAGPDWATGGSAGIEGSVPSYIALVALGLLIASNRLPGAHPSPRPIAQVPQTENDHD